MDARAEAIRVGWLDDVPGDAARSDAQERIVRLPIDAAIAVGRIDRPVEFVRETAAGLPFGTAHAVEAAYARLVEQGVVMIAGPAIGDNALVATPLADAARVPTLNWAGTELARGDWMFHLQVGSHEEEPVVLARHMVTRGFLRIAVVRDQSPIGRRYGDFFAAECDAAGVRIVRTVTISPLGTGVDDAVGEAVDSGADALVYLGLGYGGRAVGEALAARAGRFPSSATRAACSPTRSRSGAGSGTAGPTSTCTPTTTGSSPRCAPSSASRRSGGCRTRRSCTTSGRFSPKGSHAPSTSAARACAPASRASSCSPRRRAATGR